MSLPLFPGAGFESSLLTAVLVGILITAVLHETLGWGFVGLVVPGYLASIFLVRPSSGLVVAGEAVATYALVWVYVRWLAPRFRLGPLFGRDRFFALLLTSVLVRVLAEGWLLPRIAERAAGLGMPIDDGAGLYGVGLVVVPLAANVLWTPGLRRGGLQLAVATALSFVVLRFLLVPFTNLAISDFELSFEDVAASFAASPKAYIILISAALLAAVAVRRYGWSVGGTLVPGLLAIAWLTPREALATLAEVGVVLVLAQPLRARGWLRGANGSRRLLAAFLLSYAAKFLFALVAGNAYPGLTVTDLFGMGYVLPALLVERVWAFGSVARVVAPTVVLSMLGALVGVGAGVVLDRLVPMTLAPATGGVEQHAEWDVRAEIARARARVATEPPSPAAPRLTPAELTALRAALRAGLRERWGVAARMASAAGAEVTRLEGAVSIHERLDEDPARARGLGTVILMQPPRTGPVLELPLVSSEPAAALAAAQLADALDARAILVAGSTRRSRRDTERTGPLAIARQALGGPNVRLRQAKRPRLSGPKRALSTSLGARFGLPVEPASDIELALPESRWQQLVGGEALERLDLTQVERHLAGLERAVPSALAIRLFVEGALVPAVELGCDAEGARFASVAARAAGARLMRTTIPPDREALLVDGDGIAVLLAHCDGAADLHLEVPRAARELGTTELAVDLLVALEGRALVVSNSRDALVRARAALHRAVVGPRTVRLLVRGFAEWRPLDSDLVVAAGALPLGAGTDATTWLVDALAQHGLDARSATDEARDAFAWNTGPFAELVRHPRAAVLWGSADLRRRARAVLERRRAMVDQILPTVTDLGAWLDARVATAGALDRARLLALAREVVTDASPGALRDLERMARDAGAEAILWQPEAGGSHLTVAARRATNVEVLAFHLAPRVGAPAVRGTDATSVDEYAALEGRELLIGGEP